jgi:hypothetical protein
VRTDSAAETGTSRWRGVRSKRTEKAVPVCGGVGRRRATGTPPRRTLAALPHFPLGGRTTHVGRSRRVVVVVTEGEGGRWAYAVSRTYQAAAPPPVRGVGNQFA